MKRTLLLCLMAVAGALFAGNPPCVVSLAPALTETVELLAGKGVLAACSSGSGAPEELRFGYAEVEKILAAHPDWVIANDLVQPQAAQALRRLGVAVDVHQCRNFADYRAWVQRIGEKLDCRDAAEAEIARTLECEAKLRALPPLTCKVLWVVFDKPLMVAGRGSLPDEALKLVGAKNVVCGVASEYFKCSEEWVIQNQPDVIIYSVPDAPDAEHRFWGQLRAVQNGRVIANIADSPVLCPGPRWGAALLELRQKLEEVCP